MQTCAKCHNPNNLDDSIFCTNCGFELDSNFCPSEYCNRNNGNNIALPEDACYCDLCGTESTYFQEGIIFTKDFSS